MRNVITTIVALTLIASFGLAQVPDEQGGGNTLDQGRSGLCIVASRSAGSQTERLQLSGIAALGHARLDGLLVSGPSPLQVGALFVSMQPGIGSFGGISLLVDTAPQNLMVAYFGLDAVGQASIALPDFPAAWVGQSLFMQAMAPRLDGEPGYVSSNALDLQFCF